MSVPWAFRDTLYGEVTIRRQLRSQANLRHVFALQFLVCAIL